MNGLLFQLTDLLFACLIQHAIYYVIKTITCRILYFFLLLFNLYSRCSAMHFVSSCQWTNKTESPVLFDLFPTAVCEHITGPITDPCGTPYYTFVVSGHLLFTQTNCQRSEVSGFCIFQSIESNKAALRCNKIQTFSCRIFFTYYLFVVFSFILVDLLMTLVEQVINT